MAKPRRHNFVVHQNSNADDWGQSKRSGGKRGSWSPVDEDITPDREQSYVRKVKPRSENQEVFMRAINQHALTLALGPAGTGKTYLAITAAVEAFEAGEVSRIILTRPAIEAGETLGFLPGDLEEKMAPYLRPLFDCLGERMGSKRLRKMMQDGDIEIAPVAFMRGRTLNNAFVVIDEAQNCTYQQIKMLLSRLGWHSKMVVTGDPDQSDLLAGMSGLSDIARRLSVVENIGVVQLTERDIVRHPLVGEIIERLA
ncbi:MAG TPA: PhoH family protein [Alphaproteobacteria bacterium]|nr:phosphate starvation-inducible protein PhoH [Rhodospirillaceae bacterium]HRJ12960.1 PhoH family protein [Alphaproteobacteria bacterium]